MQVLGCRGTGNVKLSGGFSSINIFHDDNLNTALVWARMPVFYAIQG